MFSGNPIWESKRIFDYEYLCLEAAILTFPLRISGLASLPLSEGVSLSPSLSLALLDLVTVCSSL